MPTSYAPLLEPLPPLQERRLKTYEEALVPVPPGATPGVVQTLRHSSDVTWAQKKELRAIRCFIADTFTFGPFSAVSTPTKVLLRKDSLLRK